MQRREAMQAIGGLAAVAVVPLSAQYEPTWEIAIGPMVEPIILKRYDDGTFKAWWKGQPMIHQRTHPYSELFTSGRMWDRDDPVRGAAALRFKKQEQGIHVEWVDFVEPKQ